MFCKNCGAILKKTERFCKECGCECLSKKPSYFFIKIYSKSKYFLSLALIPILSVSIPVISIVYIISKNTRDPILATSIKDQNKIAQSTVNILCDSGSPDENQQGGSGTIIGEDGLILTNAHIIPNGKNTTCIVVLSDIENGQPETAYLAKPIVIPSLSEEYDLAFLQIFSEFKSEKNNKSFGLYPRKFPKFNYDDECRSRKVQMGEKIWILGYPAMTGGLSLTMTDGIISGFPEDGLIATSAKVGHGNSGGIAVDQNGCMIGVPSMITSSEDDKESLGVIISKERVDQFLEKTTEYIDKKNL